MENGQSEYEQKYQELELLGRGNYGSTLVMQAAPTWSKESMRRRMKIRSSISWQNA
jgi:hypothetical protein